MNLEFVIICNNNESTYLQLPSFRVPILLFHFQSTTMLPCAALWSSSSYRIMYCCKQCAQAHYNRADSSHGSMRILVDVSGFLVGCGLLRQVSSFSLFGAQYLLHTLIRRCICLCVIFVSCLSFGAYFDCAYSSLPLSLHERYTSNFSRRA